MNRTPAHGVGGRSGPTNQVGRTGTSGARTRTDNGQGTTWFVGDGPRPALFGGNRVDRTALGEPSPYC